MRAPSQCLTGSPIERCCHGVEFTFTVSIHIGALGEVLAQQAVCVLVGASLPRTPRIAEVNCQSCFNLQLRMLGHLRTLVPCQRLSQVIGQCRNLLCDGLTHRLGTMTGQGRSILDTGTCCMPVSYT